MGRKQKEYTGSAYLCVVGPDGEHGPSRDSIEKIARRPGDSPLAFIRATKGYEARQAHINNFIEKTQYEFILMLDHDQVFPMDTLERLRSHKLPYISGLYLRRNPELMAPVWYRPFGGKWPMEPWVGIPERGKLHPLGASGWGCMLMHRDVVVGVRALLKGEEEVLEDDMDIWPYDIARIMDAINGLDNLLETKNLHPVAIKAFVEVLKEEIRPLRCDREIVGSDIRFPFYAKAAGFQLMGDPEVRCGHVINYPLSPNDYDILDPDKLVEARMKQRKFVNVERRRILGQKRKVIGV